MTGKALQLDRKGSAGAELVGLGGAGEVVGQAEFEAFG